MHINVRWLALASISLGIALIAGCISQGASSRANEIRIVGSDTMLPLNRHLAATYMQSHPGAVILVEGGGSGIGIQRMIEGSTDLCAASRSLQAEENQQLFDRTGSLGVRFLVALDGIAVYLNPGNKIRNLSLTQLSGLFSGTISSWAEVGGKEIRVHPIIRPPTSGTHRFFRDRVLAGGPYSAAAETAHRTSDVVAAVSAEEGAIGYGGLAYTGDIVNAAIDGRRPILENLREGHYPLARYLYYFSAREPRGLAADFVEWVIAPEGQSAVAEVGLVPLWE